MKKETHELVDIASHAETDLYCSSWSTLIKSVVIDKAHVIVEHRN